MTNNLTDNLPEGIYICNDGVCCEGFFCEWAKVEASYRPSLRNPDSFQIFMYPLDIEEAFLRPLKFGDRKQIYALKAYQALTIKDELLDRNYSIFGI